MRIGYLPAGTHHFEFRAAGGGQTVFAGDGAIPAGLTTQLYLFGPAGGVQGRFISYPAVSVVGQAHVSLINLVRTGQSIEAVGCADATQCAPLAPPLALGETFAADFPMDATQDWPNGRFVVSSGLALGFRQVPTTAVSSPRVSPLFPDRSSFWTGCRRRARRWSERPCTCRPRATSRRPSRRAAGHRAVTDDRRRSVVCVGGK